MVPCSLSGIFALFEQVCEGRSVAVAWPVRWMCGAVAGRESGREGGREGRREKREGGRKEVGS